MRADVTDAPVFGSDPPVPAPPTPSTTVDHLPEGSSRIVTGTVQSVTACAVAAYAAAAWKIALLGRQIGRMTPQSISRNPVTVRVFSQRLSSTPRGARLARNLTLNQLHSWGIRCFESQ